MNKLNEKFHTMMNDMRDDMNENHLEVVKGLTRLDEKMKGMVEKVSNNTRDIKDNVKETNKLKTSYSLTKQKVGLISGALGLAGGLIITILRSFFGV